MHGLIHSTHFHSPSARTNGLCQPDHKGPGKSGKADRMFGEQVASAIGSCSSWRKNKRLREVKALVQDHTESNCQNRAVWSQVPACNQHTMLPLRVHGWELCSSASPGWGWLCPPEPWLGFAWTTGLRGEESQGRTVNGIFSYHRAES